ncbi:MAG: cytidine/deoxycytidylate deaminase family protein [Candidatus Omnitrophica bacterium]|nr:cytidine/deoxycytidylate deaminase family protein [Candidatus Omnitrophota bacterium]
MNNRPDWDTYFMNISRMVSSRATCLRRKVGALLVKERRILATGYNGTPSGITHCQETGCLRESMSIPSGQRHELCRGLHAEQNALLQAALHGVSVQGGTLYCTNQPCVICAKMLINAGIKEIVIEDDYTDELAVEMLREAKIKIRKLAHSKQQVFNSKDSD